MSSPAGPVLPAGAVVTGAVLAGAVLVGAAGCGAPLDIAVPDRASDPACARVAEHWPQQVAGQQPVPGAWGSEAIAVWGDPPIIARCGLPMPGPTTDDCLSVDGVDWVAQHRDDGMVFVTYGRDPAVQVLVPSAYAPEPLLLPAFDQAARQIPQGPHRCR